MFKNLPFTARFILMVSLSSLITAILLTLTAVNKSDNSIFEALLFAGLIAIGISVLISFFFTKSIQAGQNYLKEILPEIINGVKLK